MIPATFISGYSTRHSERSSTSQASQSSSSQPAQSPTSPQSPQPPPWTSGSLTISLPTHNSSSPISLTTPNTTIATTNEKTITLEPLPAHACPPYTDPPEYRIGGQVFHAPFVTVRQLKGHLGLLDAFAELKRKVMEKRIVIHGQWALSMPEDAGRRWAWFIGVAVERFQIWAQSILPYNPGYFVAQDEVPPLDVLMVWHAYLLNPRWFADDAARIPYLYNLRHDFGSYLMSYILEEGRGAFSEPPSPTRYQRWTTRTRLPWDTLGGLELLTKAIRCPHCSRNIIVDMSNRDGTGYIQKLQTFCMSYPCNGFQITKETLGVRKLANDLTNRSSNTYLAGTVFYSEIGQDMGRAQAIKQQVYSTLNQKRPPQFDVESTYFASELMEYSHETASQVLGSALEPEQYRMRFRIMCAYTDDKPFSLDLVPAVLRQSSFVQKMGGLGWTRIGFFDDAEDVLVLRHAIARYHAFLDLILSSPTNFFVPTLDIDLAWHTHQLLPIDYKNSCLNYVGKFVDHDDKVEEGTLASAFDLTFRAWQDRFGLPYMYCGCPIPGDSIGQKMARLIVHYRDSTAPILTKNVTPLLIPMQTRRDSRAATHPSDHNAVYALHRRHEVEASRAWRNTKNIRRREKHRKRLEKERKEREKGKRKADRDRERGQETEENCDYYPAFLTPVPYDNHTCPGCTNGNGNSVSGGGDGCGTGAGGCAGSAPGGNCSTRGELGSGGDDRRNSGGGGCGGGGDGGGGGGGCGGGCGG